MQTDIPGSRAPQYAGTAGSAPLREPEFSFEKSNFDGAGNFLALRRISHLKPREGCDTAYTERTMKMTFMLTALALSLAVSAPAQARMKETSAPPRANETVGREVAAPSWSSACMSDQGPSLCGEPMWVYGSRATVARFGNAF
jgi:hypothetical protein